MSKSKKSEASVDTVVGTTQEREAIGDHSFAATPAKVGERALFNRAAAAEQRLIAGEEDALDEYLECVVRILNARDPQPAPIDAAWLRDQDANETNDAMYMIATAKGNRKSQQDQG